jgi:hypothetical protein
LTFSSLDDIIKSTHAIDAKGGRLPIGIPGRLQIGMHGRLRRYPHKEDQSNLIALQSVRQELADAVFVAEDNTSGKALSGGLMNEAGKLNFVIVVLSGTKLKQVMLEPPSANNLQTLPRRSKQH